MKRVLAMILVIMVLLLSLSVPAGAQTSNEDPPVVEPIPEPYRKSVALWGADESFGGQFEIDTQNQVEGLGCASVDLSVPEVLFAADFLKSSVSDIKSTSSPPFLATVISKPID